MWKNLFFAKFVYYKRFAFIQPTVTIVYPMIISQIVSTSLNPTIGQSSDIMNNNWLTTSMYMHIHNFLPSFFPAFHFIHSVFQAIYSPTQWHPSTPESDKGRKIHK